MTAPIITVPQGHVPFIDERTKDVSKPWRDMFRAVASRLGISSSEGIRSLSGAGAPTDGGSGTGATLSPKVWLYLDETNARLYINNGTVASPLWKRLPREA